MAAVDDIITNFQHDWIYQAENIYLHLQAKFQTYVLDIYLFLSLKGRIEGGSQGEIEFNIHHIFAT